MSGSLIKRSRATMLLAAGAMVLSTATAGGAAAAPAAEKCTIKSYSPAKFAVGATNTERLFKVRTTGCTQKNWRVDLLVADGAVVLATKAKPLITFIPAGLDNSLAGRYQVLVTVRSSDNRVSKKKFDFSLQRKSTFGKTLNAGPEPTSRGAELRVVGTLKRASWETTPSDVPYAGRVVRVQFRAVGTKKFVNVQTATTDAEGNVSATVTATKSGFWRLHYAGNSTTSAANSTADGVAID